MNDRVLENSVLVLNRNWQPVQTCTVRRAVHLLSVGHARVVQEEGVEKYETHDFSSWLHYSQREPAKLMIRSVRVSLRVPKILVLAIYDQLPSKEITFSRRNVFWRDQFTCQYCWKSFSESELNLDHVIPRKKGGKTTWDNIVTSCVKCNSRKGSKLPHEVNMHPKNKPVTPRWKPDYSIRMQAFDASWEEFLSPTKDRYGLAG